VTDQQENNPTPVRKDSFSWDLKAEETMRKLVRDLNVSTADLVQATQDGPHPVIEAKMEEGK
jgi:hypothetical protein